MSINNEDLMLVNQSGVDYKTTAADLKAYLTTPLPMPWDDWDGVVLHVKDATGTVTMEGNRDVYELDGTYKGKLDTFGPGEEVVILTADCIYLFHDNHSTTWNFGELTDVSNAAEFNNMFLNCNSFNGTGMSDWDASKVTQWRSMFEGCRDFNQDLSQWCVSQTTSKPRGYDADCDAWEESNKPVWGTCPRGEDQ